MKSPPREPVNSILVSDVFRPSFTVHINNLPPPEHLSHLSPPNLRDDPTRRGRGRPAHARALQRRGDVRLFRALHLPGGARVAFPQGPTRQQRHLSPRSARASDIVPVPILRRGVRYLRLRRRLFRQTQRESLHPAHATITPLSVHHLGGGSTSGNPSSAATAASLSRTVAFAATPPATTKQLSDDVSDVSDDANASFAHSTARRVRSSRCRTAAR